jgi:branched-chain amino acid transport system ATP-binding protein
MLEVTGLTKFFGGLAAISDLNFSVDDGEIRGIIGPNGAGKTTLFNLISGIYRPTKGRITYKGEKTISGLKTSEIARMGIVRTFQHTALLQDFTVFGNVSVARHLREKEGIFQTVFGRHRSQAKENGDKAMEILSFMGMAHIKDELAMNLPHGYQRSLGVAMALATEPVLLMLDEPVTGMNQTETQHMTELIRRIRDERGMTILLVEHDMKVVMDICDNITVLNFGKKLAEGLPSEIQENEDVIEAYLGGEEVAALLGGEDVAA